MQAELDKLLASRPNPTMLPAPIPAMLKSSTEEPQAGKFPDSLWRTLRAFNPKWLALFAIRASETGGSDGPGGFPQKLVLGACEQGGVETAKAVAAAVSPSLGDWLKASAAKTVLPDVLDRDDLLVECSEAEVTVALSTYLRMSLPQLAQHFAEAKVTRGTADSVAATIVSDCRKIEKELRVPGGRHALAAKLLALVCLGRHTSGAHHIRPRTSRRSCTLTSRTRPPWQRSRFAWHIAPRWATTPTRCTPPSACRATTSRTTTLAALPSA